jgi:glycosyltransferase involved in cell wall biosynthesis
MKITFIMPNPGMSGGDRVCAIYAKLLADKGHAVQVIAPKKRLMPIKQQLKRLIKGLGWLSREAQSQNHFRLMGVNVNYLEKEEIINSHSLPNADVVIATWWETAEWVNNFPHTKGKKIYFIQHLEIHDYLPKDRVENTYKMGFYLITIAHWLVDILQKKYNAHHVSLVPNSVSHDIFFAPPRIKQAVPTIGFLYSDAKFKGIATALKVISQIKGQIPQLRVLSFGISGPKDNSFPTYFELHINPDQNSIRDIYNQCDVWLCCSQSEGFGLTILEAMACRTPTVSTKCGGPEDFVLDGKNGYLCEVNDVNGLANAAVQLLQSSEEKWLAFSNAALATAAQSSWQDSAYLFEQALFNAIQDTSVDG